MPKRISLLFVGGVNVFPNVNIQPEHGWSGEIGIKTRVFQLIILKDIYDLSGFITQYTDMMEFMFGFYDLDGSDISTAELQSIVINNGNWSIVKLLRGEKYQHSKCKYSRV